MTYTIRIEELGREILVEEGFETQEDAEKRLWDIQELHRQYDRTLDPFTHEFFVEEE